MQFCAEQGCGALVERGRCPAHRWQPSGPQAELIHRWLRSTRWQRLRADVLRRDPFCRACRLAGRKVLTVDVDHIARHRGTPALFWAASNLQGLCRSCHGRKTARGE